MSYRRIVIDAMGGDNAPEAIIEGVQGALKANSEIVCLLVGDEARIRPLLAQHKIGDDRVDVIHAPDVVTMEDDPKTAVDDKPGASINVAAGLIRDGRGDALVSAGNTGATVIACSRIIPRMAGVERGVLAAILPANKSRPGDPGLSIMVDVGATLHCTVNQLVSFAIMGLHYAHGVLGVENPRIGLVNIGEEESKGHNVLVETHKALRRMEGLNFIGNIEGKDVLKGVADVIVSEGYVGNVLLKGLEGFAEATVETGRRIYKKNLLSKLGLVMLSPVLKKLKKRLDYSEYGGAPILGFQKLVIKAHGRSGSRAIMNAILLADKSAAADLVANMEASMKAFYLSLFENAGDGAGV